MVPCESKAESAEFVHGLEFDRSRVNRISNDVKNVIQIVFYSQGLWLRNTHSVFRGWRCNFIQKSWTFFLEHKLIVAEKAIIDDLNVVKCFRSPNCDIAYHFELKESLPEDLEEGDLVGLIEKPGSVPTISVITAANFPRVFQTGVISRSAYFEGNFPMGKSTSPGDYTVHCKHGQIQH